MIRNWKPFIALLLSATSAGQAWAQAPRAATLDIAWENAVGYVDDLADPSKLVTSTGAMSANIRDFMRFTAVADIVSVNGKPARGSWALSGQLLQLSRSPMPGQAIADTSARGAMVDIYFELVQSDGTPVGAIVTSGFTGGSAPPGLPGLFCNLAVTGGTGAFQGIKGAVASPLFSTRPTSMAEDPANRRINGGTSGHWTASVMPIVWPDIVTTADGPAVFHSDFSPVTAAKPARASETLIVAATGLGPTNPAVDPGKPFPSDSLATVNSPVEMTVNGNAADVVNKVGWPGTTDRYRLDVRVPEGTAPGMAALQVRAAFIAGQEVKIPVR